eukprot:SAG22_NODE_13678_length_398_cov_0.906355_1_plen_56_part_01
MRCLRAFQCPPQADASAGNAYAELLTGHLAQLKAAGYTVFPRFLPPAVVARLRAEL